MLSWVAMQQLAHLPPTSLTCLGLLIGRRRFAAGDWKRMPEFNRLLLFHALRPDRLTAAMSKFVAGTLGRGSET